MDEVESTKIGADEVSLFTARVNLEKPEPNDLMSFGDDVLSANYSKIDAAIGTHVNAVAPAATFNGKLWSPANDTFVQDLAAWRFLGNPVYQKGFKGYDADSVFRQVNSPNPTEINVLNVNFASVLGRSYLVEFSTFAKFSDTIQQGDRFITRFKVSGSTVFTRYWGWNTGDGGLGLDLMSWFVYNEAGSSGTKSMEFWFGYETSLSGPASVNAGGVQTTLNVADWQAP